jgi:hypothetical protein
VRQETISDLKELQTTLEELISEWKKHASKLKFSKTNTPQKYEDFESVREKHLTNQQNFMNYSIK